MGNFLKLVPLIIPLLLIFLDFRENLRDTLKEKVLSVNTFNQKYQISKSIIPQISTDELTVVQSSIKKPNKQLEEVDEQNKLIKLKLKNNNFIGFYKQTDKQIKKIAHNVDGIIKVGNNEGVIVLSLNDKVQDIEIKNKILNKTYLNEEFKRVNPEDGDYQYIVVRFKDIPYLTYDIHEEGGSIKRRFTPIIHHKITIEEIPEDLKENRISMLSANYFSIDDVAYNDLGKHRKITSDFRLKGISKKKCIITINKKNDVTPEIKFEENVIAVAKMYDGYLKIISETPGLIALEYFEKNKRSKKFLPCISGIHLVEQF